MDEQQQRFNNAVDMDQVYDDAMRLADEFNSKLGSFTALISGSFILWILVVLTSGATGHDGLLLSALIFPVVPLLVLCVVATRSDQLAQWRTTTGENIVLHCTGTALCGAMCSARPLCIALLAQKEGALWRQILEVTSSSVSVGTVEGRCIYALNRLLVESARQRALVDQA
jgi:hypothetical protein